MKTYLIAACIHVSLLLFPPAGTAQGADPNAGLQTEVINDPSLGGKKAFTVMIPSGWKFQGTVIASVGCSMPYPVFRGYSPDGLTEIRLLPSFNCQMQEKKTSASEGLGAGHVCIDLNGSMTAAQFLDRYVRTLGPTHVVGPMSISTKYRRQLDNLVDKMNAVCSKDPKRGWHTTGDAAALRIETANGTFTIEQRLRARVVCTLWPKSIAGKLGSCFALLDVLRAPKGQLDALVSLADSHNLTVVKQDDQWMSVILAQIGGQGTNFDPTVPNGAAVKMLYHQAHDFGLARPYSHERELEDRNETVYRPMRQRWMDMASSTNVRSDWVDFALDPNPVTDDYGVSLVGARAHLVQLNRPALPDPQPGANPNGVLDGKWSEETKTVTTKPQ